MQQYTVYLYLQTALHVSRWYLHTSSGAHITDLQYLALLRPLLLPVVNVTGWEFLSSHVVVNVTGWEIPSSRVHDR